MSLPYAEVIGDPIAHSKSPLIHGFWLEKLGIAADYRKAHVRAGDLPAFLAARRIDADWRGCNVTVPHKEAVHRLLMAEAWGSLAPGQPDFGAVNTIVRRPDGELAGYNTDVEGVVGPINACLDRRHGAGASHPQMAAAIIGAGGAARAALHGLAALPITRSIAILARRREQAEAMLAGISCPATVAPIESASLAGIDLLVNASPLGMTGKPPLDLRLEAMNRDTALIFDMVYAPLETGLLRQAREAGIERIDGLQMLIGQASRAFELFFGQPAPRAHDAALRALLTA